MRLASPPIKGGPRVLGADVAKTSVVLFDSQDRRCVSIANEPRALRAALADLAEAELLVCEATGGYERALLEAAAAIGLAAHRADPLRVKRYIASLGGMAKTDAIDAAWLARYGQERGPSLARWRPQDADAEALAKLARHRLQLVRRRAQARNQQSAPDSQAIAPFLAAELAFLDQQVATLDQAIAQRMAGSTSLSERHKACEPSPASAPSSRPACSPSSPSSDGSAVVRSPHWPAWPRIPRTPASPANDAAPVQAAMASDPCCSWPRWPPSAPTAP